MSKFRILAVAFTAISSAFLLTVAPAVAQPSGVLKVKPAKIINFRVNLKNHSTASKYLYVYNKGKAPLTVIFGEATSPFEVACSCTKDTIPPHQMVRAVMAFKPSSAGTFTQSFHIDSDATAGKAHAILTLKGVATGKPPSASSSISGVVSAGTTPIANARVNLFAAGDDSSSSDTTLVASTATNSSGGFELTRVYCANPDAQLYAISTGGTPQGCGSQNNSLSFMTALGACGEIADSSSVTLNEMTTAASALALAPFMTNTSPPAADPSLSSDNALNNAFAEAQRMVSAQDGRMTTAGSPLQSSVESLGTSLARCAQCGGAETSACSSDTLQAAFSFAGNPPSGAN
jgi:hypothetical protein